jgi:hypothetical protein
MQEISSPDSSRVIDTLDHIDQILELLLINQLRQTDLLMAIAAGEDKELVLGIIQAHSTGKIIGDIPFMAAQPTQGAGKDNGPDK